MEDVIMLKKLYRMSPKWIKKLYHTITSNNRNKLERNASKNNVTDYWTKHRVTKGIKESFNSAAESEEFFYWRSLQYLGYLELMPVNQATDKVVLDYGCGPGHDSAGFLMCSKPKRLVCADVSPSSLEIAKERVRLHEAENIEFVQIDELSPILPFEDNTFDIIHSSGVLHHIKEHKNIIQEFKRIMKPDGYAQIMVYNYNSIWMHLYVNYSLRILEGRFKGLNNREAFARSTDGPGCPIANCYSPDEYISFIQSIEGLKCEFTGASISANEMNFLPLRYDALMDISLHSESREFIYNLTFDDRGLPLYKGSVAGVNASYKITKRT